MISLRRKKKYIIIGCIAVVLIVARLLLPYFVVKHVNKILSEIPHYTGSISDVDIHLIRGAYDIKELRLFKLDGIEKIPFIDIPKTELSVEWKAIFKGAVVGEVTFTEPTLNFIGGDKKSASGETTNQSGVDVDWTVPLKRLMPLHFNRLEIVNGSIKFYDFTTKPKANLFLKQLNLLATNLNNAERQKVALPSKVTATAISIGRGKLNVVMDINALKKIPDLDLDLKFEGINMPAINDFLYAYSKVDVEKGTFNLYSEVVVENGKVTGYVKPLALGIKIVSWKNDKQNIINLVWQSIVGMFVEIFTNQKKDQFATKVALKGDLNNLTTNVWPALGNIFKNAFIQAFEKKTDNSIKFIKPEKGETGREKRKREKKQKKQSKT